MSKIKDLVGRRFGRLVVDSKDSRNDSAGNPYYNCTCDCGNKKTIAGHSLLYNRTISCGCFGEEQRRKANRKPDKEVATNLLYLKYKYQAKRREIPFELTQKEFGNIIYQDCYYCGSLPSNSFNNYRKKNRASHLVVLYNGIDRLNSNLGYTLDNCVPSCPVCNYGKRTLDEEQFFNWIKRVYDKHFKKATELTPGQLIDLLFTTDYKCWWAQEFLSDMKNSPEERAEWALKAQELNAKRTKLIRTIDQVLDFTEDTNTEKTYANSNS